MDPDKPQTRPDAAAPVTHQPRDVQRTQGLLVLGMHRSGTSLVARLLNVMGAYVGESAELLPPHARDNPTGYWERTELVIAHDEFLKSAGFAWDHVAYFDPAHLPQASDASLRRTVHDLVRRLSQQSRPWLVKDPRLSLLLPFWLDAAPNAACVVVVRNPLAVVASLRESHRGIYASHFLLALWEKYYATLLANLDGRRAVFVAYENIVADPVEACRRLSDAARELDVDGLELPDDHALEAFVHRKRVATRKDDHVRLSVTQQSLFDWLSARAAQAGTVTVRDYPRSTPPDAELQESQRALDDRFARGRAEMQPEVEQAQRRADTATQTLRENLTRLDTLTQSLETIHREHAQQLEDTQRHVRNLFAQLLDTGTRLAESEIHLHAEREARTVAVQEAAAAQERFEAALGQVRRLEMLTAHTDEVVKERNNLAAHARALETGIGALRASLSWKLTAPLRVVGRWFTSNAVPRSAGTPLEHRLHRWFYALPGLDAARKRRLVLWLHRHMPWFTRHTLSYRLFEQTQQLIEMRAKTQPERAQLQRLDADRAAIRIAQIKNPACISLVMPVYNVEARWLEAAVDSVRRQFYPHWELCITDDASTSAETRDALDRIAALGDERIRIEYLSRNLGIAGASNAALARATGNYVGLLDNDDVLTRDALLEMACRIDTDAPDVLYSDEDKIDEDGHHVEPHFKPDFNPDYFFSINYICHFTVIRRSLMQKIGGFRAGFDGAQDYDLLLRATENGESVAHVPKVLYHWRKSATSTAAASGAKPQASDAGLRALDESLKRRGIACSVTPGPFPTTYRAERDIVGRPLVSVLIPFRDKPELLETCVRSILKRTDYEHFEILGIDNGSVGGDTHAVMKQLSIDDARVRFVRHDVPFNYSVINNFGAQQARGEHFLFLNNDTEVIDAGWMRAMLAHSQRAEVGAVGAKLLYSDDRIQHAGVIIGIGGVAGHAHIMNPATDPGYFARAQLPQNLSAVTFACAMTRREVFQQLGGLNERELTVAFNDIDYCLRALEAGFQVVYTPHALLYHHESRSRGYEDNPEKQARFAKEIAYMQQRHRDILTRGDPHYNPNLSLTNNFGVNPRYADELPL